MGKIRIKTLGNDEAEKKQKLEAAKRKEAKMMEKAKVEKPVDESMVVVENNEKEVVVEKKVKNAKSQSAKATQDRSKVKKTRSKAYSKVKATIKKDTQHSVAESIALLKKSSHVKFDETVELHFNVKETGIKGEVALPFSTGKKTTVAIVDDALLDKLEAGTIDFDVLVTSPAYMPKLAKFARLLGPKGLMPNPKNGTISEDTAAAAKKFAGGAIRFKTEAKSPLIHIGIGKLSMKEAELEGNIKEFTKAVGANKILSAFICSTMSPSMQLDLDSIL